VEHGCTKASSCDRSGSSRRLAPRLAQILTPMKAAHPHSSGCEQTAARSPLVQRSRLWPPKQRLVSASSSLSLIGQQQPLSLPRNFGTGRQGQITGKYLRARPTKAGFQPNRCSVNQRPYLDTSVDWGSFRTTAPQSIKPSTEVLAWSTKCFPLERQVMGAKIANRAVVTIQIIGWAAIIIVMAMFLTAIGTSITECLANPR
jgi:hypothetical protein